MVQTLFTMIILEKRLMKCLEFMNQSSNLSLILILVKKSLKWKMFTIHTYNHYIKLHEILFESNKYFRLNVGMSV